jgi:hypothetical protein
LGRAAIRDTLFQVLAVEGGGLKPFRRRDPGRGIAVRLAGAKEALDAAATWSAGMIAMPASSAADLSIRSAAALFALTGIGFGLPCIHGIRSLAAGEGVPLIMGFPSYGGGVFERFGVRSTVPLLVAFLVVCVLETVAAWLLWGGHRSGAILGLAILPVGMVFWIGFSLPFPPVFAAIRTVLVFISWSRLS